MKNFSKELLAQIMKAAQDENFYGKRKRDSKLEVAENITSELSLAVEASEVVSWLEDNQPEKKATKRATVNKPAASTMQGNEQARASVLPVIAGNRFIITSAQNNTKPASVFKELEKAAQKLDATLIVLPVHYNKNAFSAAVESEKEYFDNAFLPYMVDVDSWLYSNQYVKLCPSASVLPTAKFPVNSAAQLNAGELATIVPSTKQQLRTLPRLLDAPICEAWATGTSTLYNYTASRAGSEAEKDHCFGGLLVEIVDGKLAITNIRQSLDGSLMFQYSDGYYNSSNILDACVAVLGDLHCEMIDKSMFEKTLIWLEDTQPDAIVVHDIYHARDTSHHNLNSAKHNYKTRDISVLDDLKMVVEQLNDLALIAPVYCVESNHNTALDMWLDSDHVGIRRDGKNAKLFYLLNYLICQEIDEGENPLALEIALKNSDFSELPELDSDVIFGRMDKPQKYFGYDVSQHGHKGQNGSMGNHNLISKWNINLVTGHTHSPAITAKILTVGVMARLDQGYNRGGASSWQQSNALIHANGTAQIIPMNPQEV